jgi:flagellar biosynthesis anti-sigma factor FlgM
MRIEAYTQVQQIYNTSKTDKSRKSVKANASEADQLEISSVGRDYQIAKQAVAAAADVREDVTAPLRKSIQAGTYEVSVEKFADKLLNRLEEMR